MRVLVDTNILLRSARRAENLLFVQRIGRVLKIVPVLFS